MTAEAPIARIQWRPVWRIVPSRFPPIDLFERVADPADFDLLHALESLTNPRLRDEIGDISLVPTEDRVFGPGTSPIMAPFVHLNPSGSRFSDGGYGVLYAAAELETAIAETIHHAEAFMRATRERRQELDRRVYALDIDAMAHDIRGTGGDFAFARDPNRYGPAQAWAAGLRAAGAEAIAYGSVRRAGGSCVAAFKPRVASNCRQERHLCYVWDGSRIASVYEKRIFGADGPPPAP